MKPTEPEKLATQYAYLFDDLDAEMAAVYEADKALHELAEARDFRLVRAKEHEAVAGAHRARMEEVETEIAELEGKLKSLQRERKHSRMLMTTAIYNRDTKERMARDANTRMTKRKKQLLQREISKRVKTIGAQIQAGRTVL